MSEAAITADAVTKFFGDFPAVRNVSFQVMPGRVLALLGRNGAGKSTMLDMLAGLSQPSSGEIRTAGVAAGADRRSRIGVISHGQWLYEDLTAGENLAFFAKLYEVSDAAERIERWLEDTGLARFRHSRVGEFSRGMRQRLTIARAFLHQPSILLLDEPWTALDDRAIAFLSSKILAARGDGCAVVVCSHQLSEALQVADDVALLDRGKLVFAGPNDDELKARPTALYQRIQ